MSPPPSAAAERRKSRRLIRFLLVIVPPPETMKKKPDSSRRCHNVHVQRPSQNPVLCPNPGQATERTGPEPGQIPRAISHVIPRVIPLEKTRCRLWRTGRLLQKDTMASGLDMCRFENGCRVRRESACGFRKHATSESGHYDRCSANAPRLTTIIGRTCAFVKGFLRRTSNCWRTSVCWRPGCPTVPIPPRSDRVPAAGPRAGSPGPTSARRAGSGARGGRQR